MLYTVNVCTKVHRRLHACLNASLPGYTRDHTHFESLFEDADSTTTAIAVLTLIALSLAFLLGFCLGACVCSGRRELKEVNDLTEVNKCAVTQFWSRGGDKNKLHSSSTCGPLKGRADVVQFMLCEHAVFKEDLCGHCAGRDAKADRWKKST